MPSLALFFDACEKGDVAVLRGLLAKDAGLVHAELADRPHRGWTGLHAAAQRGQADAVRLLLEHGADPNAREAGDNTYAMHWAAAGGHLEVVRRLADEDLYEPFYVGRQFGIRDLNGYTLYFTQPAGM